MSESFEILSAAGAYRVEVGTNLLERELERSRDAVLVCDERFAPLLFREAHKLIAVRASEEDKDLAAMPELIRRLRNVGATRDTELIAIGGGVIQDIATFCASTYMRGLPWSYAPTTLLGMVDSCIGGKSSINVGEYKNLVGTIHPPQAIWVDTNFVSSLNMAQRVAGLCEAVKICFARGEETFESYLNLKPGPGMAADALEKVIVTSLKTKKWFIEIDEYDRSERLLLNFGHTFGHALESASSYALPHGIAVGWGMLCAYDLGLRLGRNYAKAPVVERFRSHVCELLAAAPEATAIPPHLSADRALNAFLSDKKHRADAFTVILINEHGALERTKLPRDAAHTTHIRECFAALPARTLR